MPCLNVGQELGNHLELSLCLLQVCHMGSLLEDLQPGGMPARDGGARGAMRLALRARRMLACRIAVQRRSGSVAPASVGGEWAAVQGAVPRVAPASDGSHRRHARRLLPRERSVG